MQENEAAPASLNRSRHELAVGMPPHHMSLASTPSHDLPALLTHCQAWVQPLSPATPIRLAPKDTCAGDTETSRLRGCHHGASPQHLQACPNEFTSCFNRRSRPFNAFGSLLGIGAGNESPTDDELYSDERELPIVNHD
jgi:hypothetical protein